MGLPPLVGRGAWENLTLGVATIWTGTYALCMMCSQAGYVYHTHMQYQAICLGRYCGMRSHRMNVLVGSCGKMQKKPMDCIVWNSSRAGVSTHDTYSRVTRSHTAPGHWAAGDISETRAVHAPCVSVAHTYPSSVKTEFELPPRLSASCATRRRTSSCSGLSSLWIRLELSDDLRVSGGYTYMEAKRLATAALGAFGARAAYLRHGRGPPASLHGRCGGGRWSVGRDCGSSWRRTMPARCSMDRACRTCRSGWSPR